MRASAVSHPPIFLPIFEQKRQMRYFIGLLLIGVIAMLMSCESRPTRAVAELRLDTLFTPETIDQQDFTQEQYVAFDSAMTPWYQAEYYHQCARNGKFKVDCYDCEALGINVYLQVDAQGHVADYKSLGATITCTGAHSQRSKDEFYACLLPSVQTLVFRDLLHNKVLRVFLGPHLGC